MPNADFFTRFGLFVVRDFFEPELCAELLSEARSAAGAPATVVRKGVTRTVVDEELRRTKQARVSEATSSLVEARLLALQAELETHFGMTLAYWQEQKFLVYREGDFFSPHRDSLGAHVPGVSESAEERKVSVVVFLNGESEAPGPNVYGGGYLRIYGLMDDPRMEGYGIPLIGEPGVLVAFRSELIHEVTPVTHGERFTIVSWFR